MVAKSPHGKTSTSRSSGRGTNNEPATRKRPTKATASRPARNSYPTLDQLTDQAEKLKVLADPQRLLILFHLDGNGQSTVTDICALTAQTQPAVSHHLGRLRMFKIVRKDRDKKWNRYTLTPEGKYLRDMVRRLIDRTKTS